MSYFIIVTHYESTETTSIICRSSRPLSTSVTLIVVWIRAKNSWVLSLVLNDRRHFDDVTSDGRLFQVLPLCDGECSVAERVPRSMISAGDVDQEVQSLPAATGCKPIVYVYLRVNNKILHGGCMKPSLLQILNTVIGKKCRDIKTRDIQPTSSLRTVFNCSAWSRFMVARCIESRRIMCPACDSFFCRCAASITARLNNFCMCTQPACNAPVQTLFHLIV